jgi:hypothetical protein
VTEAGGERAVHAESGVEAAAETARLWRDSLDKLPGTLHVADPKFDPQAAIEATEGPLIEVGGPTSAGYEMVDVAPLQGRFAASNRRPYAYSTPTPQDRPADFKADFRQLPLEDESVAGIFASAIPYADRSAEPSDNYGPLAAEAYRVTKEGGYLMWQHAASHALDAVIGQGWQPVAGWARPTILGGRPAFTYDVMYQKGAS